MAFTKMLWLLQSGGIGSWDYWTSDTMSMQFGWEYTITKTNKKIAYYGLARISQTHFSPIFISPDSDAVAFTFYSRISGTKYYNSIGTITDDNGIVWYISAMLDGLALPGVPSSSDGRLISENIYNYSLAGYQQAAQDLLDRIYAVPFIRDDYQYLQVYSFDFSTLADAQKTIRKAVGIFLYMNLSLYTSNSRYQAFSDNADSIISNILTLIGTNKFVLIDDIEIDNDYVTCRLYINHDNTELNTKQLQNVTDITNYGYRRFTFGSVSPADVLGYNSASVRIDALGTISAARGTSVSSLSTFTVGLQVWESNSYIHVRTTNLGIDL